MRLRDILILAGLILLILGLTVAEKYAQRNREERRSQDMARALEARQEQALQSYRQRWDDLSEGLKFTLDSIAGELVTSGVPEESLAVLMAEPVTETVYVEVPVTSESVREKPEEAPAQASDLPDTNALAVEEDPSEEDALAQRVAREYHEALRALPGDLNAYELRVATNEVATLLRARYNLDNDRFDHLLKRAATLQKSGP
jgi:hypothetical protein